MNLNRQIHVELTRLMELRLLTHEQLVRIGERYPPGAWNVVTLIRWFSIIGVVSVFAGLALLVRHLDNLQVLLEVGLGLAGVALLVGGWWLRKSERLPRGGVALELLGAMAFQGLSLALAIHYSSNSGNWPALLGIDTVLFIILAYGLRNRLILIYAVINLFIWFGGETGYHSGWGAYWLRMSYPVRFLGAGIMTLGIAYAHFRFLSGLFQSFSRVYVHFGLLVINLALWFLSLFGHYEERVRWDATEGERILFSLLWALVAVASILGASKIGLRLLRGYGLTFLIINIYTFYCQFIFANTDAFWFIHLLVIGGSLVGIAIWAERRRRRGGNEPIG